MNAASALGGHHSQIKSNNLSLDCESASRLLPSASPITINPVFFLSPKAYTHFTVSQRVEGWVEIGTTVRVRSPCPRLYIAVAVMINEPVARFESGSSHTEVGHVTTKSCNLKNMNSKYIHNTFKILRVYILFAVTICSQCQIHFTVTTALGTAATSIRLVVEHTGFHPSCLNECKSSSLYTWQSWHKGIKWKCET